MPTCQKCGKDWSWSQTFKKMFTLDTSMECPYCGEKQYYTKRSRKRTAAVSVLIPFLIFLTLLDISLYLIGGIYVVFCLSILGFLPFLIETSNEEEPLW
ncbi:TIGR04104 family putative zinc finger protein [Virgibacillus xinjiangensis]|uniref:TIGR04104 family putative zinc finger protein n=1 Tax=Virgibacillus xinjiangensis TaxID=393090 RepID=A0ABV7CQX5_9BACI